MRLSKTEESQIQDLIRDIEAKSTSKVVVHIDEFCKGDAYFKAVKIFQESGLLKHPEQNSVLIYIATKDRKLSVVHDKAIEDVDRGVTLVQHQNELGTNLTKVDLFEALSSFLESLNNYLIVHFPVKS